MDEKEEGEEGYQTPTNNTRGGGGMDAGRGALYGVVYRGLEGVNRRMGGVFRRRSRRTGRRKRKMNRGLGGDCSGYVRQ